MDAVSLAFQLPKDPAMILYKTFGAHVHNQRDLTLLDADPGLHLQKGAQQAQGQVVHTEIPDVFQGSKYSGLPGPGKAGDDEYGKRPWSGVVGRLSHRLILGVGKEFHRISANPWESPPLLEGDLWGL